MIKLEIKPKIGNLKDSSHVKIQIEGMGKHPHYRLKIENATHKSLCTFVSTKSNSLSILENVDNIYNTMTTQFVPMLETIKMTSPKVNYSSIIGNDAYCLAEINDFAALAAISQNNKTPTFALTDEQLGYAGKVKDTQKERIVLFKNIYASFADHVIKLTSDESSH